MKTKILLFTIMGLVLGIFLMGTISYVVAESLIDSKNVYYKDNSGLGFNNVQDAIDGTCTKFEEKVDNFLDKIYPVGSIYISTTMSTAAQVKEALGGEWQAYGNDKVLRGTGSKAEVTGGSDTVTLTTDNLPSHTHSFTPAGSVASTFTGTAVNTSTTGNHYHSFSGNTSTTGAHSHSVGMSGGYSYGIAGLQSGATIDYWYLGPGDVGVGPTTSSGNHYHTYSGNTSTTGNHYHSVTAAGSVSSTFTGTAGNTGATGGGKSFSVQDAYITVFMYKRIS